MEKHFSQLDEMLSKGQILLIAESIRPHYRKYPPLDYPPYLWAVARGYKDLVLQFLEQLPIQDRGASIQVALEKRNEDMLKLLVDTGHVVTDDSVRYALRHNMSGAILALLVKGKTAPFIVRWARYTFNIHSYAT